MVYFIHWPALGTFVTGFALGCCGNVTMDDQVCFCEFLPTLSGCGAAGGIAGAAWGTRLLPMSPLACAVVWACCGYFC